jgi:hypothetical protein
MILCQRCIRQRPLELKPQIIERLCAGGEPVEMFTIRQVHTRCPEARGVLLLGDMAFTDKGICFIQLAEGFRPDAAPGIVFGLVGQLAAESTASDHTDAAYAHGRQTIAPGEPGLVEWMQQSLRVMHYPAAEITDVGFGWWSGFHIKTPGKTHIFKLRGGKQVYEQFRPRIEAYLDTIGRDNKANPCSPND